MLKHLSLFAGCGGIDLGFKWAGIETVAGVEIKQCLSIFRLYFHSSFFTSAEYK